MAPIPASNPVVPITFDYAAIRTHVEMMHGLASGVNGLLVVSTFYANPNGDKDVPGVVSHHRVGDVDGMVEAIVCHAETPNANVFAGLQVMRPDLERGKRGTESDILALLGLVVDLDADTGCDGAMPIEPHLVLETSPGNRQPFVLFDRPVEPAEAKPLAAALKRATGSDHGTADIAHVWRIPGTLNFPNRKKLERGRSVDPASVFVVEGWQGDLISVEDMRAALEPWAADVREASSFAMGELPASGSVHAGDRAAELLAACDVGDRSNHAARVVEQLAFDGHSPEAALLLFLNAPGDWLTRYPTEDRATSDFRRLWGKFAVPLIEEREQLSVSVSGFLDRVASKPPLVAANDNKPQATDGLPFVFPSVWEGVPVPRREWFIEKYVPLRTVTLLTGDGGLGKSLLTLQVSIASALGCESVGLNPRQGRTLYVGAEDEVDEFHRRINDVLAAAGASYRDLRENFLLLPLADRDATLALPDKSGKMVPTPLFERLFDRIVEFRPGLVVLDTSADLYGGDEIKRSQVRQFVAMLRQIAIICDCAVILLSHPSVSGMQSGAGTSGSTAWNNSVRSRLYLTGETGEGADPDGRILTNMKSNYGAKGGALKMRWEKGVFVLNDGSTPNPTRRLMEAKAEAVFLALLSKFSRQGVVVGTIPGTNYAPAKMAERADADGVEKKALASAMLRLLDDGRVKVIEEGPPSKPRRRLIVSAEDYGAKDGN